MDTSQYLELFIDETKEHLQSLNEHILDLEKDPENNDTINEIFRAAHTLKGMAGTMGFARMQRLTHDLENVFQEIRNGNMKANAKLVDIMFRGLDALESYLDVILQTGSEGTEDNEDIIHDLNEVIEEETNGGGEKKEVSAPVVPSVAPASSSDSQVWENKFERIPVSEYEIGSMEKAKKDGQNVFGVTVYLQESCILKAARAFLVFKAVESKGELIKSLPTTEQIEDEEFEQDFSWILATEESKENVRNLIMSVSEIAAVCVEDFKYESAEAVKEEVKKDEAPTKVPEKNEPKKAAQTPPAAKGKVTSRSVRVDIDKLDVLMNLVSELIIAKNALVSVSSADAARESGEDTNEGRSQAFHENIEYLERVTTNLHESVMKVRMVPIESVVNKFPRMIRDLSKKLDKKMELYMSGEETELDRTVVDEIGDPLMHLLRNAADHGLESGAVRKSKGKPEVGSIFLDAYQDGNNVVIEVRDDGAGINTAAVKEKAIMKGVITPEQGENMSEQEIINLLFSAGFSTSEVVSDVSGRGVGLDVVKSKIESLSGEVEVKSKIDIGSTWTIRLPLTLAIIQALMVDVGGEKYAISLGSIQTIEDIIPSDIKTVQNKEVIHLRGIVIPLIRLSEVLDIASKKNPEDNMTVVIVKKGDRLSGIVVDELMGQQEIVIKSLGKYITKCKVISGATILGDGEVALILDTNALF